VDYIGDTVRFEADFAKHVAVAQALGPYKLSLHSGSDKFSIYPIISHLVGGMIHLKTAGTSYLEALRTVAHIDPLLFRAILNDSCRSFEIDRASYHVSASLANMPLTSELDNADLPMLLDQFDARQVLHVTFGSILDRYSTQLKEVLLQNEDAYYTTLETHFAKHLAPFQMA
jgi:hypothetical protein